jgi:hypothetical protein
MTNPVSDPGQVPALDQAEVPAAAALAHAAELPAGTPGLAGAPTDPGAPPAAAAAPATDRKGALHDPQLHEVPPRLNCEGCWARRRGNGARRAKGLPLSGHSTIASAKPKPAAPPAAAPAADQPAAADDAGSFLAPPPAGGAVVAAEVMPEALRTPEDYTGTASALVFTLFGVARILMGKAWEADKEESRAWNEALRRTLAHYQAPTLGPVAELIPLAVTTAAKRADDQQTREKVGGFLAWLRGVFGRRQVVRQPVEPQQQQAEAPRGVVLAGASPRVEY